jgi:hypothetical protein
VHSGCLLVSSIPALKRFHRFVLIHPDAANRMNLAGPLVVLLFGQGVSPAWFSVSGDSSSGVRHKESFLVPIEIQIV